MNRTRMMRIDGQLIRNWRANAGWTRETVAVAAGVTSRTLAEAELRGRISPYTASRLAAVLPSPPVAVMELLAAAGHADLVERERRESIVNAKAKADAKESA